MILPHFKKVTDFIHQNSDMKVFYHTCGSVYELIDCFIEMGIDILNPLQVSADKMEPETLVEEFGEKIIFWGGGCDTQRVLPEGTENDVKKEVENRLDAFTKVEGYVFTPVHNIQPDVPGNNIKVMYEIVNNYNL
jgi:uroporphyrinogen-III decarboxylase